MNFKLEDNMLIICPEKTKIDILKYLNKNKQMINIKFITIDEFCKNYFFDYNYKTISYIITKYQIDIDNIKTYMKYLYSIEIDKNYQNKKLIFLQNLLKDSLENNLLIFNAGFKEYINSKKLVVINYPLLEKYLDNILKKLNAKFINNTIKEKKYIAEEAGSMEEEISYVAEKICSLKEKNISLNDIYIVNYNKNYYYTIKKVFKEYNIPVELPSNKNILSTKLVEQYLVTKKIPKINNENKDLVEKLVDILNKLVDIEESDNYKTILKYLLKSSSIKETRYKESVKISDLFEKTFNDNEYVFLIGYNDDTFPKKYRDEEYIADNMLEEIDLYTTTEKNKREKEISLNYLSNINNLSISYKLNDFKNEYYISDLIENIDIEKYNNNNYKYSNKHNKRLLGIYLDNLYKYKELNKDIYKLLNTYDNIYNTYSNKFNNKLKDKLLDNLELFKLSYTRMNSYNSCPFKYYVNYVLKVDPFDESFVLLIGNLFHHVLELSYDDDFDFDYAWNSYLEERDLKVKERYLLNKLKKILQEEIEIMKENEQNTDFNNIMTEKEIEIPLNYKDKKCIFSGKIDKIMYYKEINNTHFAVVDYKTGSFPRNLNNMKYGLDMQLAVYLYLIEKSNLFESPIFAGMYFEKMLMTNMNYDSKKTYREKLKENMRLIGYTTDNEDILKHLDYNYTDSDMIKGLKLTSKGFSRYSNLLSNDKEYNIYKYTEEKINETLKNIVNAKFDIIPKKIGTSYNSCNLCKYKDLCYKTEDDYEELEPVSNLDFLEGDKNA